MAGTRRQLIDTGLLIERKRRAVRRAVPGADFLMRRAAEDLAERLATVGRRFGKAATLFSGTTDALDVVLASGKVDEAIRVEADAALLGGAAGTVAAPGVVPLEPASIDLAVSLLSLQDENDIPGMLIQIRRALKPDGLFLGALAGVRYAGRIARQPAGRRSGDCWAGRARACCPSPTCATPARCCSGRALRCR